MNIKRILKLIFNFGVDEQGHKEHKTAFLICTGCSVGLKRLNPYYHVGFCKECGSKYALPKSYVNSFFTFLDPNSFLPACDYPLNFIEDWQSSRTTKEVAIKLTQENEFAWEPLIGYLDNPEHIQNIWDKSNRTLSYSKAIAGNKHTPQNILLSFVRDTDDQLTESFFPTLAGAYDGIILSHLASNPSIGDVVFEYLLHQRNISILFHLSQNPSTDYSRAKRIMEVTRELNIHEAILQKHYFKILEDCSNIIRKGNKR